MTTRKINWMALGIIVLVLLNIGLVAMLWMRQQNDKPAETPQAAGGPGTMMIRELSFDSLQARRFDTLRNAHHARVEQLRKDMRRLKELFFEGIRHNEQASDSVAGAMAALQVEVDRTTYNHFRQVRALCTPDQQEKFDRIFQRILAQMGNPGRARAGGPGGQRRDRPQHDGPPGDGPPEGPPADH
jgi:protein CpxP